MPRIRAAQSPVKPRYESSDEEDAANVQNSDEDIETSENGDLSGIENDEASANSESDGEEDDVEVDAVSNLRDISFGALAKAQAALVTNLRKRKRTELEEEPEGLPSSAVRSKDSFRGAATSAEAKLSRGSKHAPTISSSKKPVSRRRDIFSPPPATKSRDPRFDASIVADATRGNQVVMANANKNYSFLSDYQAAEVLDLKAQIKKTKNPDQQAEIKRKIMSIEARLRNAQTKKREAEILEAHNRQEKEAIRQGRKSKPYYLKPSEVKKQIDQERKDKMGKRARDKSDKRRQKREKGKQGREMPRFRRSAANES